MNKLRFIERPAKDVGLFQLSHNGFFVFNLDKIENGVMGKCHFTLRGAQTKPRGEVEFPSPYTQQKTKSIGCEQNVFGVLRSRKSFSAFMQIFCG